MRDPNKELKTCCAECEWWDKLTEREEDIEALLLEDDE